MVKPLALPRFRAGQKPNERRKTLAKIRGRRRSLSEVASGAEELSNAVTLSIATEEVQVVGELRNTGELHFPLSTADGTRFEQLCLLEETTANQTDGPLGAPDIIYTRALRQLWDDELTDDAIHKYLRLLCDIDVPR